MLYILYAAGRAAIMTLDVDLREEIRPAADGLLENLARHAAESDIKDNSTNTINDPRVLTSLMSVRL